MSSSKHIKPLLKYKFISPPIEEGEFFVTTVVKEGTMPRIFFSVTQEELAELEKRAEQYGSPNIESYCKEIALQQDSFAKAWQAVKETIRKKSPGEKFTLRDLGVHTTGVLGVQLFKHQKELHIRLLKKNSLHANQYIKL